MGDLQNWGGAGDGHFAIGKHPTLEIHTKGTLLLDMASRVTVVRIWKTSLRAESLGSVSSVEARTMLQEVLVQVLRASDDGDDRSVGLFP